jgi:hypothetical protein
MIPSDARGAQCTAGIHHRMERLSRLVGQIPAFVGGDVRRLFLPRCNPLLRPRQLQAVIHVEFERMRGHPEPLDLLHL